MEAAEKVEDLVEDQVEDTEFERTPVPSTHFKKASTFVGMFAGEHAAGTEFMIGPLFVARGVSAFDVLVGLLVGNFLAVLSWRYICAPIATRTRMTLYYKLEKICGPALVNVYNILNGLLFCFLAGAMVAVSATAVGVPFDLKMPGLDDMLPNSVGWILAVFGVGTVISIVAAKGYDTVARFSGLAAPWMVLVFLACGLAALPELGVTSFDNLGQILVERVWTGVPVEGQTKMGFAHMVFFGWFCNLAMHIGMADMSIFRFAKKSSYGWASAFGAYIGHYMAWIAAGLLYAVQLNVDPNNTNVAPGPMAFGVAGWAGILCVIVAGWTTANPTIYRAGLAFQSLLPSWSRVRVTILAGAIATIGACFPGLAMKLLGFVALYGLVLMPMGAIIFQDFWVLPKLGLAPDHAAKTGKKFYVAPFLAWVITLAASLALAQLADIEVFFLALPGWFLASVLYIAFSKSAQSKNALGAK